VVGEARARTGKRFTYHRSELMAPYGTFLADLPIYSNPSGIDIKAYNCAGFDDASLNCSSAAE
jgi:hypothetical protein